MWSMNLLRYNSSERPFRRNMPYKHNCFMKIGFELRKEEVFAGNNHCGEPISEARRGMYVMLMDMCKDDCGFQGNGDFR